MLDSKSHLEQELMTRPWDILDDGEEDLMTLPWELLADGEEELTLPWELLEDAGGWLAPQQEELMVRIEED
jgi:hypothetical protein